MARFGFDLDGTIYKYPAVFRDIVQALVKDGHECFITSNHFRPMWEHMDVVRLKALGFDPAWFDPSLMQPGPVDGGAANKGRMADQVAAVFDDDAHLFQPLTSTPLFRVM